MTPSCTHRVVRVLEWVNDFGPLVGCRCGATFQIPEEHMERWWTHFTHTSSQGPEHDVTILVHDSMLK